MTTNYINEQEKRLLLHLARETIDRAVHGDPPPTINLEDLSEPLRQPGASFVTLRIDGELRGCIGTIEARDPLALDVQNNALGSAFRDPRFPPLTTQEFENVEIELSILTPPQTLDYDGPDDLLDKIRPGVDGLIIEKGWHRATLLPSVWEKIPDPLEFLSILCRKAGLSPDAWRQPDLIVRIYQAEKITE